MDGSNAYELGVEESQFTGWYRVLGMFRDEG